MYNFSLNFYLITPIHIPLCSSVVSKKVQLANYIISSVNSLFRADQINLFLYEAVQGHRSEYHFSLDFHLFSHTLISLYRSVVSNKNQLTNFTNSVNSLFTAGQINFFCLFCMKLCLVTSLCITSL